MGHDDGTAEHRRPGDVRDALGQGDRDSARSVTLGSRELADLLLEMGRAATSGELGVYRRDELDRAHESGYAQGWQDAVQFLAEQGGADPHTTSLAEVIALMDAPLPAPRASELRSQEPLMPHRKRKPGERSG
ncbi:hypothetical protein [Streptomyces sp. NPDC017529]|uniref:hypothetical protein n=1 Tax=Streptomyces sp. NPDC017529 TaxID=3365000 RepID=UPI003787BA39